MMKTPSKRKQADGLVVRIVRDFAATPEQLWNMWTDPVHFAEWFGPSGCTGVVDHMDVRAGGTFRFGMHTPDGNTIWSRGEYEEVSPFIKLVYHEHEDLKSSSDNSSEWHLVMTLTFEPIATGTRMTLEQHGWPNEQWRSMAEGIWTEALDKMAGQLSRTSIEL